jgi:23S rRNA (adenine1618-N6)-methyltransferase
MSSEKKSTEKIRLHEKNKNRDRYDLEALKLAVPALVEHVMLNKHGVESVDFANPVAVKLLNKALLSHYYGIKNWEFPDENLCPPIPGRADYIHYVADLLAEINGEEAPKGEKITCLDVGMGASNIYPIIGVTEYGWNFIGSDIDPKSIASAEHIVNANPSLKGKIDLRLQKKPGDFFSGIIGFDEKIEVTICNPPFHASIEEAESGTKRKIKNLTGKKVKTPELNFAGISSELICEGGEFQFINNMIHESKNYAKSCIWFSTIVSKQSHLKGLYQTLDLVRTKQVKTVPMGTGNKASRIVAWTFLTRDEQKEWKEARWEDNSPAKEK